MAYTNNVPQATQIIAATQAPIEANFAYIETTVAQNHTWQTNPIGTEAAGSHQKLEMPNQGSDIAALPMGIAAVVYAIGGNLFAWNGAKRPVSGVTGVVSLQPTSTPQTVLALPSDCIGLILAPGATVGTTAAAIFYSISSTPLTTKNIGDSSGFSFSMSGLNLQARSTVVYGAAVNFKYIYWPI